MNTASAFSQSGVVHDLGNKFYFSFETQSVRQFVQNGGPDIFKEHYVFYLPSVGDSMLCCEAQALCQKFRTSGGEAFRPMWKTNLV